MARHTALVIAVINATGRILAATKTSAKNAGVQPTQTFQQNAGDPHPLPVCF